MNALNEYAVMLMTASVIGCVLKLSLPDKGIKKALAWLISLVMLTAAASPVKTLINNFTISSTDLVSPASAENSVDYYTDALVDASVANIEKNITGTIAVRYGAEVITELIINAEDVSNIMITQVKISICEAKDARKSSDIGRYIADMMGCEVEVIGIEGSEYYRFAV